LPTPKSLFILKDEYNTDEKYPLGLWLYVLSKNTPFPSSVIIIEEDDTVQKLLKLFWINKELNNQSL